MTSVPAHPLRIVFAGSPAAAVPSLQVLARGAHGVLAVLTREDSALGRKRVMTPTPVASLAESLGIPVIKANRLAGRATEEITALAPDLGVIVAYGGDGTFIQTKGLNRVEQSIVVAMRKCDSVV